MNAIERFQTYAADFEKACESDDWSVVAPHFRQDAVYQTIGPAPLAGVTEGRDAILTQLEASLDGFDRRFDSRELELLEGPVLRDGAVWIRWRASYRRAGVPDVVLDGEEKAWIEPDGIRRLEDRFDEAGATRALATFAEHQSALK